MSGLAEKKANGTEIAQAILRPAETAPALVQQQDSMLGLIERMLTSPDFDVSKLQQILDVRERYEAAEAKRAFVAAKARFKTFAINITKDKENKQYGSRYTSVGNLVNTVTPFLSQCGLDASWELDQAEGIKVTCVLTHEFGHSSRVAIKVPADTSGAKNPLQQIKSAITYARIITFESVCGLASTDYTVNVDDDGNSAGGEVAGKAKGLSEERYVALMDSVKHAGNFDELKRLYMVANKEAAAADDDTATTEFSKAKNKRYRELSNV